MAIMQKAEKILGEMEELLNHLIESAKKLLDLSKHVIDEDELLHLQEEQETLLIHLVKKDGDFHKLPNASDTNLMPRRLKIDEKIDEFQRLNAAFVENINATHGLIQFEKKHTKK